jgi:argininosuccinate lyase
MSQVDKMPPEFVMMTEMATAVARRMWGTVLLAFQVSSAGIMPYEPDTEKNREKYFRAFESVTRMLSEVLGGLEIGTRRTVEDCKPDKAQECENYQCEASSLKCVRN